MSTTRDKHQQFNRRSASKIMLWPFNPLTVIRTFDNWHRIVNSVNRLTIGIESPIKHMRCSGCLYCHLRIQLAVKVYDFRPLAVNDLHRNRAIANLAHALRCRGCLYRQLRVQLAVKVDDTLSLAPIKHGYATQCLYCQLALKSMTLWRVSG